MAVVDTLNSLGKIILPKENPVELTITNNTITIDPNSGSYFFLDDIDSNLTINISSLSASSKTIYLKLNFDEDNIVISWPNNIKWQELISPNISQYEDLFISLMTLDGGTTWYSEPVIKTKPLTDLSYYMANKYPGSYRTLTSIPVSDILYFSKIRPTSLDNTFSGALGASSGSTSYLELDVSDLDTSNVTNMQGVFYYCSSLTSLDLSNWDTSNVTVTSNMFRSCSSLTSLDLSDWDTSKVSNDAFMFTDCDLEYMILNSNTVKMTKSNGLNNTCKILVPSSALNTYKSHSAWSSRASQFDAIENYTITRSNGQVTVTPNT